MSCLVVHLLYLSHLRLAKDQIIFMTSGYVKPWTCTATDSLSVEWRAELVRPNVVSFNFVYFFETADFV